MDDYVVIYISVLLIYICWVCIAACFKLSRREQQQWTAPPQDPAPVAAESQAQESGGDGPRAQETVVINIVYSGGVNKNDVKIVSSLISASKNNPAGVAAGGTDQECVICLSRKDMPYFWTVLPQCQHGFHADCLAQWLQIRRTCPICRYACG